MLFGIPIWLLLLIGCIGLIAVIMFVKSLRVLLVSLGLIVFTAVGFRVMGDRVDNFLGSTFDTSTTFGLNTEGLGFLTGAILGILIAPFIAWNYYAPKEKAVNAYWLGGIAVLSFVVATALVTTKGLRVS